MEHWSVEDYKNYTDKKTSKKAKYRSYKTSIDGHTFDSLKEANYYNDLKLRLKGKGVVDLRGGKKGDEIVTVRVKVNDDLSRKEKELYKQLQELQESSRSETLWTKFKNQFK